MNHQISTKTRYDDEIDLMELLMILVKEKKIVFLTMVIVVLLSFVGALYERDISRKVSAIFSVKKGYDSESLLVTSALEKVYRENDIREKNKISLDEFRSKFLITGIIPKEIEDKKEFLAKNAQTLEYIPRSYRIDLRVGSLEESKKILKDYYVYLNQYYRDINESKYRFKEIDLSILNDERYSYEDYLKILDDRKNSLKEIIAGRERTRTDYVSYGYGYREIQIALENLESIRVQNLKDYFLATNIVRNPDRFKSEYLNKKIVLENKIKEKKEEAQNYKKVLDSYRFESSNIVVPKGAKISIKDNPKERYYTELIDQYLEVENELIAFQEQLKELIYIDKNLKIETELEYIYIMSDLEDIIVSYNSIVKEANSLEIKENYIENGSLIKLAAPIEVISNSKEKLILGIGIVMGLFLGVMMAFIKNFYQTFKNFKKTIVLLALFSFVGVNSYSKVEITLQFTHKEIKEGLNPDKTAFNLDEILVEKFLTEKLNLKKEALKNISIVPIFPEGSLGYVQGRLKSSEENYLYLPTEYKVILNLKDSKEEEKIKKEIVQNFPIFYTNCFFQNTKIKFDYLESYDSYRNILKALDNFIVGLSKEIDLRKSSAETREIFYEYNNLGIELNKIKDISYWSILNYIRSNNIVSNVRLEKTLLNGENRGIYLKLSFLEAKKNIYLNILNEYNINEKQAFVLEESGDISMSSETGLREKQYIDISKRYLEVLNKENILKTQLSQNKKLVEFMKEPSEIERDKISKELLDIQNEVNDINAKMADIEMKDYKREYIGSVRAF